MGIVLYTWFLGVNYSFHVSEVYVTSTVSLVRCHKHDVAFCPFYLIADVLHQFPLTCCQEINGSPHLSPTGLYKPFRARRRRGKPRWCASCSPSLGIEGPMWANEFLG